MSVDVTALVGGAVGGAAIQSVLGPLFGQVHDRRELRARTLEGVAAVESARWVSSDMDHERLRAALKELRSAALVAGMARSLIDTYILAASAAFRLSRESWEQSGGDPEGGGISIHLSAYVTECAEAVTSYAWHPWWGRIKVGRTGHRLRAERDRVDARMGREKIDWSHVWTPY